MTEREAGNSSGGAVQSDFTSPDQFSHRTQIKQLKVTCLRRNSLRLAAMTSCVVSACKATYWCRLTRHQVGVGEVQWPPVKQIAIYPFLHMTAIIASIHWARIAMNGSKSIVMFDATAYVSVESGPKGRRHLLPPLLDCHKITIDGTGWHRETGRKN